jgi:hypothetical protein
MFASRRLFQRCASLLPRNSRDKPKSPMNPFDLGDPFHRALVEQRARGDSRRGVSQRGHTNDRLSRDISAGGGGGGEKRSRTGKASTGVRSLSQGHYQKVTIFNAAIAVEGQKTTISGQRPLEK